MPTDKKIIIKANELRIGNYVSVNGKIIKVNDIDEIGINSFTDCDFESVDYGGYFDVNKVNNPRHSVYLIEPIPLTDDRLLKFGFKKEEFWEDYILEKEVFFQDDDCFGLIKCLDSFKFCVDSETGFNTINEKSYNYLHEIQNLYFDLKNTE